MHGQAKKRAGHDSHHDWRRQHIPSPAPVTEKNAATPSPAVTTSSSSSSSPTASSAATQTPPAPTKASVTSSQSIASPSPSTSEGLLGISSVVLSDAVPTHVGGVTLSVLSSTTTSTSSSASQKGTTPSSALAIAPPASATSASLRTLSVTLSSSSTSGSTGAATSTSTPTAQPSGGLGSAGTAIIVLASVLGGCALLIFIIRKTFIARRKRRRNSWEAGLFPEMEEKLSDPSPIEPPVVPEKNSGPRTPVWAPPRPSFETPGSPYYVTPPPMTYNPAMDSAGSLSPNPIMSPRPVSSGVETAVVRQVYIPTLPDELSVAGGEIVQLVKAFDDGWGLCQNSRGEQGVVPLECLDRGSAQGPHLTVSYGQQDGGSEWHNMKRMSSLSTQQPQY